MSKQLWTPEEVLRCIRNLHEAGHDLSHGNTMKVAPNLVAAARRYLGSWGGAVEQAGIDFAPFAETARQRALARKTKWSKEHILECIREAAARNEPLQTAVASRMHPDLYAAACSHRYFGGWANALKAAGIQVVRDKPGEPGEHTASLAKWKADLLLERIGQLVKEEFPIDVSNLQNTAPTLYEALIRRFGSWAEALRAAESAAGPKSKRHRQTRGE